MSAIGGIVTENKKLDISALKKLLRSSIHRGDDSETLWHSASTGFIQKQLWTTPESLHEIQPLYDKENGLVLTADARLDNREELILQLSLAQRSVLKVTDVELILYSYIKWRSNCVDHLVGDFAFAIWDINNRSLFCARDHLGIKPFYYVIYRESFYFASEISAIFSASGMQKKVNTKEIEHFLDARAIACEATFFESILCLLPGHYLVYAGGMLQKKRYWFPEKIAINKTISFADAKHKFRTLLQEAVDDRLRSAYDVGCELSGGVDSSSILALTLNSSISTTVSPFTTRYGKLSCDEERYIDAMVNKYDLEPIVTWADQLDYSHEFSLSDYYKIAPDWPGRGSFLDAKAEMQSAQERGVRVILTGQGGDHVAAGNNARLTDYFLERDYKRLWEEFSTYPFRLKTLKNYFFLPLFPEQIKTFLKILLGRTKKKRFTSMQNCFHSMTSAQSYMQKFEIDILCGVSNQLWLESNPYTTIGGLYNIEFRHPFFDKRIVEFMLSLPPWMKVKAGKNKIILREALKDLLPETIYLRDDKAEFTDIIELQLQQNSTKKDSMRFGTGNHSSAEEQIEYNINEAWKHLSINKWILNNKCKDDEERK